MKKFLTIILSAALLFTLCITSYAMDLSEVTTSVVGSGISDDILTYTNGDYEARVVQSGFVSKFQDGGVYVFTQDASQHIAKLQVKYPADQGNSELRYNLALAFPDGTSKTTSFKVYAKDMTTVIMTKETTYWETNRWKASGDPYCATSGTDTLSFTVDMNTGAYSFYVNTNSFGTGTIDVTGGVGMVEYYADFRTNASGVFMKGASVTDAGTNTVLGSGTPGTNISYTSGDYESIVAPGNGTYVSYESGAVKVKNRNNDRRTSSLVIKNNAAQDSAGDKLIFEFDVNSTGHSFLANNTKLKIYGKNDLSTPIATVTDLQWSSGEWKLSGNTPATTTRTVIKLTVDAGTGEYTLYGGDYQFSVGPGTVNIANGIGMVQLDLQTDDHTGDTVVVNDMALKKEAASTVGDFTLTEGANSATASVNLRANSAASKYAGKTVCVLVAAYNEENGEIVSLSAANLASQAIAVGTDYAFSAALDDLGGGTKVKAFLWDWQNLTPFTDALE